VDVASALVNVPSVFFGLQQLFELFARQMRRKWRCKCEHILFQLVCELLRGEQLTELIALLGAYVVDFPGKYIFIITMNCYKRYMN
jgi:hypothetical protein